MNYKLIISYIFLTLFLLTIYYISWLSSTLNSFLSLIIYCFIFYFLQKIWSNIRKKESMNFNDFLNYFIVRISLFLFFIISFFWITTFSINNFFQATMPEYTISNWEKEVKFQTMSHIWSETYYKNVVKNIYNYKKQWWVLFFEWVRPGKIENKEKFDSAIGIKFNEWLYKNFWKLYWVSTQNNNDFLWLVNNKDFNIDVSLDDIIKLYEEKVGIWSWYTEEQKHYKIDSLDVNTEIINALSHLNDRELKILVYINQAILNLIIWSESTQNLINNNFTNQKLFEVILDERNKVLTNEIINTEFDKIYVTYWLLHFKWVLKLLKENNPNWKIVEIKNLYPIKN